MGFLPRLPGGLLSGGHGDLEQEPPRRLGDVGMVKAMEVRKIAAKAFFEADCNQALRNVLAGGPRPHYEYSIGQTADFYRIGNSKSGEKVAQRWHGPARIVMTDLPSTVWLSYQGGLIKASPERLRPASEEEEMTISGWLEGLTTMRKEFEKEPKCGYIDLTQQPIPEFHEDNHEDDVDFEDDDPEVRDEERRVRHRIRGKTPRLPEPFIPVRRAQTGQEDEQDVREQPGRADDDMAVDLPPLETGTPASNKDLPGEDLTRPREPPEMTNE